MSKRTGTKVQKNRTDDEFIMLPTVDFCFKELMRNEKVRKGIIAALLGVRPEEIKETRLLPTILRKEYEDDKYGILDVRVEMHDGTQIDFEMQVAEFDFWKKRIVFYLSKMVTDQIHKGDDYDKFRNAFMSVFWILYISRRITGTIEKLHFAIQKRERFIQISWRFMCWNWGSYHRKIRTKKES